MTAPISSSRQTCSIALFSLTITLVSAVAIGLICLRAGSMEHVVASLTGEALPLVVLSGASFVTFCISLVYGGVQGREVEEDYNDGFVDEIDYEGDEISEEEEGAPTPEEEETDVKEPLEAESPDTLTPPRTRERSMSKLLHVPFGRSRGPTIPSRGHAATIFKRAGMFSLTRGAKPVIGANELLKLGFDFSPLAQHKEEMRTIETQLMRLVTDFDEYMVPAIEAHYYTHNNTTRGEAHPPELLAELAGWTEASKATKENIQAFFKVLQREVLIPHEQAFEYFTSILGSFLYLGSMKAIASQRMVTAHNFKVTGKVETIHGIRREALNFYEAITRIDEDPEALLQIQHSLVYLTVACFGNFKSAELKELKEHAELFFGVLLGDNSQLMKQIVRKHQGVLKQLKEDKGVGGLVLLNLLLRESIKMQPLGEDATRLKALFQRLFNKWIQHAIPMVPKVASQVLQVVVQEVLPLIPAILEADSFKPDASIQSTGKLVPGMKIALALSTYNCAPRNEENTAFLTALFHALIATNHDREKTKMVAFVREPAGQLVSYAPRKLLKKESLRPKEEGTREIGGHQMAKYYFPFLPMYIKFLGMKINWADWLQTETAKGGLVSQIAANVVTPATRGQLQSVALLFYDGFVARHPRNKGGVFFKTPTSGFRAPFTAVSTTTINAFRKALATAIKKPGSCDDSDFIDVSQLSAEQIISIVGEHWKLAGEEFRKAIPQTSGTTFQPPASKPESKGQ